MIIDLHVHVQEYSADSFLPVREAIARARAIGLDGLCVTDHDSLGILEIIDRLRAESGFPIFAGAEYLTTDGDFLTFGLDTLPEPGLSAAQLQQRVEAAGGVTVACHPFRTNNRGVGDGARSLPFTHAVECFNGSTSQAHNLRALRMAESLGAARTGSSDAHRADRLGRFATRFPGPIRNTAELIGALRARKSTPVMRIQGGFMDITDTPYYLSAPEGDADL